jgi:pyridoxamine 5'-phosphate oxidase
LSLADLRKDYGRFGLTEADLDANPYRQFRTWLDQAEASGLTEPNAMTLSTCSLDGFPSARVVLLRGLDERGFAFFTSYESRKGKELNANPRASLTFYWASLERQVRIEGDVERVSVQESDAYFRARPRGSQLSACTSAQSEVVPNRLALETRWAQLEIEYAGREVPRPPFWGGFRVRPHSIEFWQGRPNRLHDRLRYRLLQNGVWIVERLSP